MRPSSQFSRNDSLPFLSGYHRMACSHKEHPPDLNPSTPSDQLELSASESENICEDQKDWWHFTGVQSLIQSDTSPETDPGESFIFSCTPTCSSLLCQFNFILTWSASTKMILSTAKGNRTSKKRILYPQIMRCFSVCWCSQRGHLYWTNSYWKPYASAMCEMVS